MKIHTGADVDSGAAHTVTVTVANEADISLLPNLLREGDEVIFVDAGYISDSYKRGARALGLHWRANDKRKAGRDNLSASQSKAQPQAVADQGPHGAPISHHQMPVWLPAGSLQGPGEEPCAGHGLDGHGESLLAAWETGGPNTGQIRQKTSGMLKSEGVFGQGCFLGRKNREKRHPLSMFDSIRGPLGACRT